MEPSLINTTASVGGLDFPPSSGFRAKKKKKKRENFILNPSCTVYRPLLSAVASASGGPGCSLLRWHIHSRSLERGARERYDRMKLRRFYWSRVAPID